ncbi:carbohydrate-binding domain-containing protein [Muricoccus aerilatus]|uniref:carbohydrate-binding domain-containing protein n=1 Tax=Muricoccus aerilatus TaxID=452982 RepID=UPI000694840C|nr:carbohydrate-binding domain-containing protein [Roseomonas aerilata]
MSTLSVGAGQQFSTIASAIAASRDGDVVAVQAGTYTNDFASVNTKITIEGVGGLAHLNASGNIPNGKGILITNTDVTIKDLAFSGATVADGNGAGIRYQGGNLTIEDSLFENNQNGLLANPVSDGTITIRSSEFNHNGVGDGRTHNLYVGEIAKLTIDNSYFHDAVIGHEIKSRAHETTVTNSRIAEGTDGTGSYSIDVPDGGKVVVANNVIQQGARSDNPGMIHFGGENGPYAGSSISVTDNTVINHFVSPSASLLLNDTGAPAYVSGNSVFGLPNQVVSGVGDVLNTIKLAVAPLLDLSHPYSGQATPAPVATPAPAPVVTPDPVPAADTDHPAPVTTPAPVLAPAPVPVADTNTPAPVTAPPPVVAQPVAGPGDLVLHVSEDAWQGDAQFIVTIDGQQSGGIRTATASHAAGQHNDVVISGLAEGQHTVGITFLNDAWGGTDSTDRNLYLDSISYAGKETAVNAALNSAGTATATVGDAPAPAGNAPAQAGHSFTLHLSEDAWQGDAQFVAIADGRQVGSGAVTASHAAGATQDFTFNVANAPSNITVAFINDAYGGTAATDRNLYVDGISVDGHDVASANAALHSSSIVNFHVDPWG